MLARVVVVENDLYNVALIQDVRIGVVAVHCRISCSRASVHYAVERRHNWRSICDIVEESADECQ